MMLSTDYMDKRITSIKNWNGFLFHITLLIKGQYSTGLIFYVLAYKLKLKVKKNSHLGLAQGFHLSTYLLHVVCAFSPFPWMNWNFSIFSSPIHTYCSILWVMRFMDWFYHIGDNFLVPLHRLLFGFPPPRFSKSAESTLKEIVDWYVFEKYSYIRVYGYHDSPHTLPTFIPNRFVLKEISYHIVSIGITRVLKDNRKSLWPSFPIQIGPYKLKYV